MSRNLIIIAVAAIVLVAAVLLLGGQQGRQPKTPAPTQTSVEEQTPTETTETEEQEEATEGATIEKVDVEIRNFAFGPKTITIKKGTKVTWTNQDPVAHTATADDGSFGTALLAKGESESVVFDKTGTFTYHCTPHPYMKATVIVEQ